MAPHSRAVVKQRAPASKPITALMRARLRHADTAAMSRITDSIANPIIITRSMPVIPYTLNEGGLWREFARYTTFPAHIPREAYEAVDHDHPGGAGPHHRALLLYVDGERARRVRGVHGVQRPLQLRDCGREHAGRSHRNRAPHRLWTHRQGDGRDDRVRQSRAGFGTVPHAVNGGA